MARLYYSAEELLGRPSFPGVLDPTHIHYHFRPARPANLLVTKDATSGETNVMAGTYGVLTNQPYTLCLHIAKHSFDSARNIQRIGGECVVALPGHDLVNETWYTSLPLPRGIFEGDIGTLTPLPSKIVQVPGIAECAVNLECGIELVKDWHTHYALFLKVVGASVDEEVLEQDRLAIIRNFPTYEVDDQTNAFGGAVERLGVNAELLECPGFPVGAKRGGPAGTQAWIEDLQAEGYLSESEASTVLNWLREWEALVETSGGAQREVARRQLTHALELAAWEEWEDLHLHLA